MMNDKNGWIRILEATIAIMLVSGVLLVMYSRSVEEEDIYERVYSLQKEVLLDIATLNDLRAAALNNDVKKLNEHAGLKIPLAFKYSVKVCELESNSCNLNVTEIRKTRNKDVYAEQVIIAGGHDVYDPKKVKIFLWEAG